MNKQEEYRDDHLRQYVSRKMIENAPEDFTAKVMARIYTEKLPSIVRESAWKKYLVPVISISVTILLIVSAFLIPESQSDSLALPALKLLKNFTASLPEFNLTSIFRLTVPSVIIYVFIGMLILSAFDRALSGIFKREKQIRS